MKPQNEVSRTSTKLRCRECNGNIVYITGQFSCTVDCFIQTIRYYWCDECQEDFDVGELTITGG
jgi:hypothetical protein